MEAWMVQEHLKRLREEQSPQWEPEPLWIPAPPPPEPRETPDSEPRRVIVIDL